jgi:hypothetical protein
VETASESWSLFILLDSFLTDTAKLYCMVDNKKLSREILANCSKAYESLKITPLFNLSNNEYAVADGYVVDMLIEQLRVMVNELDKISSLVNSTKDHITAMCENILRLLEIAPNLRADERGSIVHKREAFSIMNLLGNQYITLKNILK